MPVPEDVDIVIVGRPPPKNREEIVCVFPTCFTRELSSDYDDRDTWPLGYQLHERCWNLSLRIIGSSRVEQNLDLFVQSVVQVSKSRREQRRKSGTRSVPLWIESERMAYVLEFDTVQTFHKAHVEDFRQNPMKCVREQVDRYARILGEKNLPLPHDPQNITELRDLIAEAVQRQANNSGRAGKRAKLVNVGQTGVPIELQMIIIGALDATSDVRNVLSAFDWQLPDTYWWARFPKETVFEYENLVGVDLDWKYACLGAEDLLKTSHGLRNRKRILEELKEIQTIFDRLLKKKEELTPNRAT